MLLHVVVVVFRCCCGLGGGSDIYGEAVKVCLQQSVFLLDPFRFLKDDA
jgi:hypothetical protein